MGKKAIVVLLVVVQLLISSCATHQIVASSYSEEQIGTDQDSVHTIIRKEVIVYKKIR